MARATRHGGPSLTPDELADPAPPYRKFLAERPTLGEVDKPKKVETEEVETEEVEELTPDGTDSSPSSENENPSSDKPNRSRQSPARTTENHSDKQGKATGSSAPSTGTGGRNNPPKQSARKRGGARFTEDELDDFDEFD